jgi:thymidine phosphorylase
LDALEIARVCQELGAGRTRTDEALDVRVGARLMLVLGDRVNKNDPWLEVHHPEPRLAASLRERLAASLSIVDQPPSHIPRVIAMI